MSEDHESPAPDAEQGAPATAHTELVEAEPDAWIGRVLDGRYRIEAKLGEGGMGAVFIARHLKLQKQVALKVIREELAGNGEVAIRFAREAMATAQFEHPHVASAIDYGGLPEGGAYFVMQLVRGRSLRDRLQAGAMPWRNACRIVAQVADALSAARATGIVHRDLKPENILVETREDGSELVRVLDFGIAHVAPSAQPAPEGAMPSRELTRVGTVMGTPGYMAPEQAVGDRVDHRADLYALGVVLWECVAGRELWEGPDITTIITRQVSEEPPPLSQVVPNTWIPPELEQCVKQLLARHPDDRPEHAGEVRDLLQSLSQQPDGVADPDSQVLERISQVAEQVGEQVTDLARTGQGKARHYVQAFLAQPAPTRKLQLSAAGAVVALLVGVWSLTGDDDAPRRAAAKKSQPASVVEKMTSAVEEAAGAVAPKMQAALSPGIPLSIADEVDTMLEGERRLERRDAAVVVLAYEPAEAVKPYLLAVAELEAARTCRDRKKAIDAIVELGDTDALPVLERWRKAPRKGCGFLNLEDCYRCIRRPLREAVKALSGDEPADEDDK